MRFVTQFYVEPTNVQGNTLCLAGDEARHAVQVLRHKRGDRIVASDGLGRSYEAEILIASSKAVEAKIVACEVGKNEPKTKLILAVGLTKGEKLDWLVEKATEMGVSAIWPFFARHSEVKWDDKQEEKSRSRWERIALAAFKQCGRSLIPKIEILKSLPEVIDRRRDGVILAAHSIEDAPTDLGLAAIDRQMMAAVGPEGGFAPEEIELVRQAGGRLVSLGPRRLRTETAGLVLAAKILALKAEL